MEHLDVTTSSSSTFAGHEIDLFLIFFLGFGQSIRIRLTESDTHPAPAPAPVSRRDGFGRKIEESAQHRLFSIFSFDNLTLNYMILSVS
uniref:Putative ovule protein n=1 Tax=Solanum chacoense TaxID=4108 RepID=A0A0V0IPZ3_SOLCH